MSAVNSFDAFMPFAQEATMLARSVKEHERRKGLKEGFSGAPGDCLAFKYYRDVRPPAFTQQCLP